jgi:flagellar assembly factor FliW
MEIVTRRYGRPERLEVDAADIYEFCPGLAGFEAYTRYAIIREPDSPVEWLQSLDEPGLAFATLEPFLFYPGFSFELPDRDCDDLALRKPDSATIRCLLTLSTSMEEITANLLAPIVLNRESRLARQVVLADSDLPLRFPVLDAMQMSLSA